LSDDKLEDSDIEPAPKLIEAVLQNCRGHVDQWLEPYLRVSIERLRKTQKHYLKDLLMEVVRLSPNPLLENATFEHLSADVTNESLKVGILLNTKSTEIFVLIGPVVAGLCTSCSIPRKGPGAEALCCGLLCM
jgi:hypothetical protein